MQLDWAVFVSVNGTPVAGFWHALMVRLQAITTFDVLWLGHNLNLGKMKRGGSSSEETRLVGQLIAKKYHMQEIDSYYEDVERTDGVAAGCTGYVLSRKMMNVVVKKGGLRHYEGLKKAKHDAVDAMLNSEEATKNSHFLLPPIIWDCKSNSLSERIKG